VCVFVCVCVCARVRVCLRMNVREGAFESVHACVPAMIQQTVHKNGKTTTIPRPPPSPDLPQNRIRVMSPSGSHLERKFLQAFP
jgi:hypothetical protein